MSVPAYAQLQKLKGQELDTAEEHDHEKKEVSLSCGFTEVHRSPWVHSAFRYFFDMDTLYLLWIHMLHGNCIGAASNIDPHLTMRQLLILKYMCTAVSNESAFD